MKNKKIKKTKYNQKKMSKKRTIDTMLGTSFILEPPVLYPPEEQRKQSILGIDLSLTSPGVAIYHTVDKIWHLFAFSQKKRQLPCINKRIADRTYVTIWPSIPSSQEKSDVERYAFIVKKIISIVKPEQLSAVHLEAYAYPRPEEAGHSAKLHELGGILKHEMLKLGISDIKSIVNSSWKKKVVGKGTATKWDTYRHVCDTWNIDLLKIDPAAKIKETNVPNPIQDLADAMCLTQI